MILISPIIRLVCKIATMLLYLVTLAAAYGGFVNPQYFTLPSMLTLALPYFAGATILAAAIWFWRRSLLMGALGVLTVIAGWGPVSQAFPLSFPKDAPKGAFTFKLLTFNSLHLQDIKHPDGSDRNRAVDFLINCGADVICLQELIAWDSPIEVPDITPAQRDSLSRAYPYSAGNSASDQKILSKYPVTEIEEFSGPSIGATRTFKYFRVDFPGHRIGIVNMHMISYSLTEQERRVITDMKSKHEIKDNIREFKSSIWGKMKTSFQRRAEYTDQLLAATANVKIPLIVCGDFNDVPASWSYRKIIGAGFRDAYADTGFGPMATYNQHLFFFHIDQIFYRGDLEPLWVKRLKHDTSDHYPLEAEFALL